MATDIKDFVYTIQETADLLKVSPRSIRRYINKGKLKAYRVAGERQLRIKGEDLLELLEPVANPEADNHIREDASNEKLDSPSADRHPTVEARTSYAQQSSPS